MYGGIASGNSRTTKSTYEQEFLDQTQTAMEKHKDDLKFKLERAREDAEATAKLAKDIDDLNQVMEDLATLVHVSYLLINID